MEAKIKLYRAIDLGEFTIELDKQDLATLIEGGQVRTRIEGDNHNTWIGIRYIDKSK